MDFPGCVSSVIFTQGCNFRCPYCHNKELLPCTSGAVDIQEVMQHISRNKSLLDGVVITGGEPTLQPDLVGFISDIKQLGLSVKLDTNGTNAEVLRELIEKRLVDYVAMDIKADLNNDRYRMASGIKTDEVMLNSVKSSIQLIKDSGIQSEFRTTVCSELITPHEILNIATYVGDDHRYYIQQYEAGGKPKFTSFSEADIALVNEQFPDCSNVHWR